MPAPAPEPARHPFAYAIVRVVPRVERGEAMNAGIVLLCRPQRFLGARVALDEARLRALDPACDPADVRPHLEAIERIAAGDPAGGPIAALSPGGALPLARRPVVDDHPAVRGPHGPDRRPGGDAGAPVRDARRSRPPTADRPTGPTPDEGGAT